MIFTIFRQLCGDTSTEEVITSNIVPQRSKCEHIPVVLSDKIWVIFLKCALPYIQLFPAVKMTPTSSTYCILKSSQCLCLGDFHAKLMPFARHVKRMLIDNDLIFHIICLQKMPQPRQPQREALMGTKNHQCLHLRSSGFDYNDIFLQFTLKRRFNNGVNSVNRIWSFRGQQNYPNK